MNLIKVLRKERKLSQQALASSLGVSRSTIAMWETSGSQPDVDALNRLADYFGVTVDYLLGREDQVKKESPAPLVESEADLARKKLYSMLEGMNEDQLEKLLAIIDLIAGA